MIEKAGRAESIDHNSASHDQSLLVAQGGFLSRPQAAWQIGQWSLLSERLVFGQSSRRVFDLPLDKIEAVAQERRKFILVHKPVIRLTFLHPRRNDRRDAWLIASPLDRWAESLRLLTGLRLDDATGERNRAAGVLPAESADPASDVAQGDEIPGAEPQFEVHDEAEALWVVAVIPGVRKETLRAEVHGRSLDVETETAHGPCALRIPLPCRVLPQPTELKCANDVLSARLKKTAWR
jgi:HSP20 family molecular chaperone IbpA